MELINLLPFIQLALSPFQLANSRARRVREGDNSSKTQSSGKKAFRISIDSQHMKSDANRKPVVVTRTERPERVSTWIDCGRENLFVRSWAWVQLAPQVQPSFGVNKHIKVSLKQQDSRFLSCALFLSHANSPARFATLTFDIELAAERKVLSTTRLLASSLQARQLDCTSSSVITFLQEANDGSQKDEKAAKINR